MSDPKADLLTYLAQAHDALLWKLDGLSEHDVRRPLTPTGTNLLGLLKHMAGVEAGYLGVCFDRPFPEPLPWMEMTAEPNADMWATAEESRADLLALHARVRGHATATAQALPLDAPGRVPWWRPESQEVTLHRILLHLVAEAHRHAGHADVVRELVDGRAGLRPDNDNLPEVDEQWWVAYRDRLEQVAREAPSD